MLNIAQARILKIAAVSILSIGLATATTIQAADKNNTLDSPANKPAQMSEENTPKVSTENNLKPNLKNNYAGAEGRKSTRSSRPGPHSSTGGHRFNSGNVTGLKRHSFDPAYAPMPYPLRSSQDSQLPPGHDDLITSQIEHTKTRDKEVGPPGWRMTSNGGLAYGNPADKRFWVQVSGVGRFDYVAFMGSYRDKNIVNDTGYPNGAAIRKLQTNFDGGLGPCWEYTLQLAFFGSHNTFDGVHTHSLVEFQDSWLAYSGFAENNELFIGHIGGYWFGLDNPTSTSWGAFMEKSLPAVAFYPGDGPGLMTDMWWDMGEITLIATQPEHGSRIVLDDGTTFYGRDRWRVIGRATLAPIHELGDVWHFGVSGVYRRNDGELNGEIISDIDGISAPPGLRARNTLKLVNAGDIRANYARQFNFEMARQCGPLILEGEYSHMFVHRLGDPLRNLRFHGWNLQGRYLLTGEAHKYDVRDGTFGKIEICDPAIGAWEVAARWDFINLNDKNLVGGSETNYTFGLNWFVNENIRFTANYIRANIKPRNNGTPRHLDILGFRAQLRFH